MFGKLSDNICGAKITKYGRPAVPKSQKNGFLALLLCLYNKITEFLVENGSTSNVCHAKGNGKFSLFSLLTAGRVQP
ncbi:Hypothetical predicted protein [Octopus vulgaris]|uniref:Uncharacterized protein n=1 Tax=Octopus vulgaris TaxID=6645 RepID=A0AA36BKU0_OCTVU|nr:Hypothetical predicted protein [Octopus vulgaris]